MRHALAALYFILPVPALAASQPETIIVTGTQPDVDARTDTPANMLPQSTDVYTGAFIRDTDPAQLSDILRYSPGLIPDGYDLSYDFIRMRGFDASTSLYLDGMRYDGAIQIKAETYGMQEIRVLRGPVSAEYGQGAPGGMVDMESKRPQEDADFLRFGGAWGSYHSYMLRTDGNHAFGDGLAGRLVGSLSHTGNFTQGSSGDTRFYLAPSVSWQMDENTELTLLGSYQHDRLNTAIPLPAEGTVYAGTFGKIPLNTNIANPGRSDIISGSRFHGGYLLTHDFSSAVTWHSKMRLSLEDQNWWRIMVPVLQMGQYLYRYPYSGDGFWSNISTDNYLSARFTTGALQHDLVAGSDFYRFSHYWYSQTSTTYMLLDMKNPDYAAEQFPVSAGTVYTTEHISDLGVYARDDIRYGRFLLNAGLRWDGAYTENTGVKQNDVRFTPNVGLSWNFWQDMHLYADYSTSFQPQAGTTYQGTALRPDSGRQWETGIKSGFFDNTVTFTLALYDITHSHVSRTDPEHSQYYLTTGKERSRGVEAALRGEILTNWIGMLSYSYTDARVVRDPTYPKGDQLTGTPQNALTLWTRYAFSGMLHGFSLSGSLTRYASQAGDLPNSFRLPAYTLLGTELSYNYGPATLDFKVSNLLNSRYFAGAESALAVLPGTPRSLQVRLRTDF